jgi:Flp pilus assembly protein TadD
VAAVASTSEQQKLQRMRALLASDPRNEPLWQSCCDLAASGRDYAALEELAHHRLAATPADPQGLHRQAIALMGLKRFEAALEPLGALAASLPQDAAVARDLGLCHYALRRFDAAKPYFAARYAAGERDAELLRLLVSTYHHLGLMGEALAIAKDNSGPARADGALAGVYALLFFDADDPMRAARYASLALEKNPDSTDALVVQGTLRIAQMRLDEAQRDFDRVIERAPTNGRAWIGIGTTALLRRDFAAARKALRSGVENMATHVGSWHLLAWTELVSGDLDEAERLFTHALELDRNFAESHGALAAVAALRADRATAEREIEVANRLDPDGLAAKFAESLLLRAGGDPERARSLIMDTISGLAAQRASPLSELLSRLGKRKP